MALNISQTFRRPLAAATAIAAALTLSLAGCSSSNPSSDSQSTNTGAPVVSTGGSNGGDATDGGSYAAMFEQARQEATSDFERRVLEDNQITRAEYEEAVQLYVKCLADKGITVKAEDQDGFFTYSVSSDDDAKFQQEDGTCAEGTTAYIADLYMNIQANPNNQDINQLTAECLVNTGLADPSFTGDKITELMAQGQSAKWPFDTEDQRFKDCMVNPTAAQNK